MCVCACMHVCTHTCLPYINKAPPIIFSVMSVEVKGQTPLVIRPTVAPTVMGTVSCRNTYLRYRYPANIVLTVRYTFGYIFVECNLLKGKHYAALITHSVKLFL